jgi:hypothetical protein
MHPIFARDSWLWRILFYAGMVVVVVSGLIENPADYGISVVAWRWFKLVAAVITALGGKFGMSPTDLSRNMKNGGGK